MNRFFLAILCLSGLLLGFVSCNDSKTISQPVIFESMMLDTVCPLFKNYDKPACHISIKFDVPSQANDADLKHAVEQFITLLPKDGAYENSSNGSVDQMINDYVRSYIMQYLSEGPDAIDSYGEDMEAAATWMSYEEDVEGKVMYNDKGVLSYQFHIYSYTGGAHGFTKTYNGVLDLANNSLVTSTHLFKDDKHEEVNNLLRKQLAMDNGCESVEELIEKGQFFAPNEIEITDNFYVSNEGITWIFDPYDIAPFNMGEISISLSWDSIFPFLKTETSVMKLAID